MTGSGIGYLAELEQLLEQRKGASTDESYTARLYAGGRSRIAQKVGEEAVELAIATVQADRQRILAEAADLIYHVMVLLRYNDLTLAEVARELSQRQR